MTKDYGIALADAYDAVISVGVFGFDPPHLTHLHHKNGAAKKATPVVITVNGFSWTIHNWDDSFALQLNKHGIACVRNEPIQHMTRDSIGARLIELRRRKGGHLSIIGGMAKDLIAQSQKMDGRKMLSLAMLFDPSQLLSFGDS